MAFANTLTIVMDFIDSFAAAVRSVMVHRQPLDSWFMAYRNSTCRQTTDTTTTSGVWHPSHVDVRMGRSHTPTPNIFYAPVEPMDAVTQIAVSRLSSLDHDYSLPASSDAIYCNRFGGSRFRWVDVSAVALLAHLPC
jgi:hypothetical protein